MNEFNKGAWLEKTSEYMAYIEQHKKNVVAAWGELKAALRDITLIQRPEILNEMPRKRRFCWSAAWWCWQWRLLPTSLPQVRLRARRPSWIWWKTRGAYSARPLAR